MNTPKANRGYLVRSRYHLAGSWRFYLHALRRRQRAAVTDAASSGAGGRLGSFKLPRRYLYRLRRTSQFISATTFGTTADAERLIAKVQGIHLRVSGKDKDGTPYQASDPALLTWVHVAECSSFMASHLRYKRTVVSAARQEQYYQEAAEIARRLGARDIPVTPRQVADYLQDMRPTLRCDERTQEVADVLLSTRLPGRLSQPVGRMMMRAGIDLLPPWAQAMLNLPMSALQRHSARIAVHGVARVLRASVRNGAYHCAMRRMNQF